MNFEIDNEALQKELEELAKMLEEDSKQNEEVELNEEEDYIVMDKEEKILGTPENEEDEEIVIPTETKKQTITFREEADNNDIITTEVNMPIYLTNDITLPSEVMVERISEIQKANEKLGKDIEEHYRSQGLSEMVKKLEYGQIRMKPINITKRSIIDVIQELLLWRKNLTNKAKEIQNKKEKERFLDVLKLFEKEELDLSRIFICEDLGQFLVDNKRGADITNKYYVEIPKGGAYDIRKILIYDEPSTNLTKEELNLYLKQELLVIKEKVCKLFKILGNFKKMVRMIAAPINVDGTLIFTSFLNFIYPNQDFFVCTDGKMEDLKRDLAIYRKLILMNLRVKPVYRESGKPLYGKTGPQYMKLLDNRFCGNNIGVEYSSEKVKLPIIKKINIPYEEGTYNLKELKELWNRNGVIEMRDKPEDYAIFTQKFKLNNGNEMEIRALENIRDSAQIMINNIKEKKSYSKLSFWAKLINIMILISISSIPEAANAVTTTDVKYYDCSDITKQEGLYSTCEFFWNTEGTLKIEDFKTNGITSNNHQIPYETAWTEMYENLERMVSIWPLSSDDLDKLKAQLILFARANSNIWDREKDITTNSINKIVQETVEATEPIIASLADSIVIPDFSDLESIEEKMDKLIEKGIEAAYNLSEADGNISKQIIDMAAEIAEDNTEILEGVAAIIEELTAEAKLEQIGIVTRNQPKQTIYSMVKEIKANTQNLQTENDCIKDVSSIQAELEDIKSILTQKMINETLTIYGLVFDMFLKEEKFCDIREINNCTEISGTDNCYYEGKMYQGKTLPILVCENPERRISSENTNTQLTLADVETTVKSENTKSILITLIPMIIMIMIAIISNLASLSIGIFGMWWKFRKLAEIIENRTINRASDAEIRNSLPTQNENEEY